MADDLTVGVCTGGPLDGAEVTVRAPGGFLAVDRAAGTAWRYIRQPGGTFAVSVDHDDSLSYPHGATTGERTLDADRLWQAGEQSHLDILAVDGGH